MRSLVSALLCICTLSAHADSIPLSPNDVPLFYSIAGQDPKYHDAAFKAQQAFFIQTGVTPTYEKVTGYVTSEVTRKVNYAVDKYMPFTSKTAALVLGTAYTVCVKKQITRSFNDPLNNSITHTVSVSVGSVSTDIRIPIR